MVLQNHWMNFDDQVCEISQIPHAHSKLLFTQGALISVCVYKLTTVSMVTGLDTFDRLLSLVSVFFFYGWPLILPIYPPSITLSFTLLITCALSLSSSCSVLLLFFKLEHISRVSHSVWSNNIKKNFEQLSFAGDNNGLRISSVMSQLFAVCDAFWFILVHYTV